jgi:hypothetical protein
MGRLCAGLADENLNSDIVRGLLRRKPDLDMDDPALLVWCAAQNRVLITHDCPHRHSVCLSPDNKGRTNARRV